MAAGSYVQLTPFSATPSPPPAGSLLLYVVGTTIFLEDASGNTYPFGSTTAINQLTGDVSAVGPGSAVATVNSVGGQIASAIAAATIKVGAASSANSPSTLVVRDSSGNFAAGTITAALIGNVTGNVSGSAASFTGSLAGDVTGTQGATSIASGIVTGKVLTGLTTGTNSPILATDTILVAFEKLQAQVSATVSGAITALTGDVSATGPGSVAATVNSVGGKTASDIASAVTTVDAATSANTASTLVERDASGNFAAGTISAALAGNATTATTAVNFTGSLAGDVTGTQGATVVATVGGKTASDIAAATATVDAATSANTASTLVKRDASGNFAAGTISAALNGNATTATTSTNFTGSLAGDVTGTQSATAIAAATVTGKVLTGLTTGTNTVILATDTILVALEKLQAQTSASVAAAITALTGDVSATGPGSVAATVNSVGGKSAAAIAQSVTDTQNATNANTASTIVKRDASGNFAAGTISAALNGNATTATNATTAVNFTGSLTGDITGTQAATVVSKIQGVTVVGTTGTGNVVFSISPTLTGTLSAAIANFSGAVGITLSSLDALVINSTSFIFDSVNNALGIGTQPGTNTFIDAVNSSGASKTLQLTGYGTGSTVGTRGRFARGTSSLPTAAQLGDIINFWSARGYGASQFAAASTGAINAIAGENFTNTSNMTYLSFLTTPTGSVTSAEAMRVASTGITLGPQSASTAVHQINGGVQQTVRVVTAGFTIDTTTSDFIIMCNHSAPITITLPTPVLGRIIKIKDISGLANTNNITIARHATESIEGLAASKILQTNFGAWTFTNDGTNWWMV